METCTKCGGKMVPAGVSKKTGKPYQAFCSVCHSKQDAAPAQQQPVFNPPLKKGPDWDAIAVGKTASLFIAAQLQAGAGIDDINVSKTIKLAEQVVEGTK